MKYLITGGTGTLAKAVIPLLLAQRDTEEVRILARNEHRLLEVAASAPDRIKPCIGDVRDRDRVNAALRGVQGVFIFHAMKQVPLCEMHPVENYTVNVQGTENVVHCAIEQEIPRVIYIGSDKQVAPVNSYGCAKGLASRLVIASNAWGHKTKLSVVLYGNVLNSRGSVVELWQRQHEAKKRLTLVEDPMTRFYISKKKAAEFVFESFKWGKGGETFIPKMKSVETSVLLNYLFEDYEGPEYIKARPGEKFHECLISKDEMYDVTDGGNCYIKWPYPSFPFKRIGDKPKWTEGQESYGYLSSNAPELTKKEILGMLNE